METSTTTSKGQIVIPKKFRRRFGIIPGTKVIFIEKNGELIIRAMTKEYFDSYAGILKGDVLGELMKEKQKEKEL